MSYRQPLQQVTIRNSHTATTVNLKLIGKGHYTKREYFVVLKSRTNDPQAFQQNLDQKFGPLNHQEAEARFISLREEEVRFGGRIIQQK